MSGEITHQKSRFLAFPNEVTAEVVSHLAHDELKSWSLVSRGLSLHATRVLWSNVKINVTPRRRDRLDDFLSCALQKPQLLDCIRSLSLDVSERPKSSDPDAAPIPFPPHPSEDFWMLLRSFFDGAKRLESMRLSIRSTYESVAPIPAKFFSTIKSSAVAHRITSFSGSGRIQDLFTVFLSFPILKWVDIAPEFFSKEPMPLLTTADVPPLVSDVRGSVELIACFAQTGHLTRIRCVGEIDLLPGGPDENKNLLMIQEAISQSPALLELTADLALDTDAEDDTLSELTHFAHPTVTRFGLHITNHTMHMCWGGLETAPILVPLRNGVLHLFPSLAFCRLVFVSADFIQVDSDDTEVLEKLIRTVEGFLDGGDVCGDALTRIWFECMDWEYPEMSGESTEGLRIAAERVDGLWSVTTQPIANLEPYSNREDLMALP